MVTHRGWVEAHMPISPCITSSCCHPPCCRANQKVRHHMHQVRTVYSAFSSGSSVGNGAKIRQIVNNQDTDIWNPFLWGVLFHFLDWSTQTINWLPDCRLLWVVRQTSVPTCCLAIPHSCIQPLIMHIRKSRWWVRVIRT